MPKTLASCAMRISWMALGLCACSAVQGVSTLGDREQRVLQELEGARSASVPQPPLFYYMPQGWPVLCLGTVVACGDGATSLCVTDSSE